MSDLALTVYDDDGNERTLTLPTRWEICGTCRGEGTHAHGIGAITATEWAEDWDADERADYLAGHYDRRCEDCDGSGKVRTVDEDRADPDDLRAWQDEMAARADADAEAAAERRMGA